LFADSAADVDDLTLLIMLTRNVPKDIDSGSTFATREWGGPAGMGSGRGSEFVPFVKAARAQEDHQDGVEGGTGVVAQRGQAIEKCDDLRLVVER
jgi:hypothetical protein